MTVQEQINNLDFLSIAQQVAPVDGADVYFYAMSNENINVRKTAVSDFETWIVIYNHFDGTTVIITGAAPLTNAERYTLVQQLENVIKLAPVVIEPEVPTEIPPQE
jgi:F0F1-type ATP synthase delta subunit